MEQRKNTLPAVRNSDLLADRLVDDAADAAARGPVRSDGWTPERIRAFLHALAQCGIVADAARAAGMSKQSAYAFRNGARGRGFDVAWRAALLLARRRIADDVVSRAINGCVEVIMRDGEVWGERHRYDNRLTMAVLTRLDQQASSYHGGEEAPRRLAGEFDQLVDAVSAGGEAAARFIHSRTSLPWQAFDEVHLLARNEEYAAGTPAAPGEENADEWQPSTSSTSPTAKPPPARRRVRGPRSGKERAF